MAFASAFAQSQPGGGQPGGGQPGGGQPGGGQPGGGQPGGGQPGGGQPGGGQPGGGQPGGGGNSSTNSPSGAARLAILRELAQAQGNLWRPQTIITPRACQVME